MILVDTSAIFALMIRRDRHHKHANRWYTENAGNNLLATTQLIIAECWHLAMSRFDHVSADKACEAALHTFSVLDVDSSLLAAALDIRTKYHDSGMSLIDASSLAVCESLQIREVFTFDRVHFGIYRPSFRKSLKLLPEMA